MDILIQFFALFKSHVEYLDILLQNASPELHVNEMKLNTVCKTSKHGNFAEKDLAKSFPLSGLKKAQEHLIEQVTY